MTTQRHNPAYRFAQKAVQSMLLCTAFLISTAVDIYENSSGGKEHEEWGMGDQNAAGAGSERDIYLELSRGIFGI